MRSSGRGRRWGGRRERHVGGPGRDVDDGRRTWQSRAVFSADHTAHPTKHTNSHLKQASARIATVTHRAAVDFIQRAASLLRHLRDPVLDRQVREAGTVVACEATSGSESILGARHG